MPAKKLIPLLYCAILCCSCGIKISSYQKRMAYNIDETNAKGFSSIITNGEILAEDTIGTHRFVIVKDNLPTTGSDIKLQLHLYDEQFTFRSFILSGYKRKISVFTIADFNSDSVNFTENAKALFKNSAAITEKSCNMVSGIKSLADLNFSLFKVAGKDTGTANKKDSASDKNSITTAALKMASKLNDTTEKINSLAVSKKDSTAENQTSGNNKYFTGIIIQRVPCTESHLFKIASDLAHLSVNFACNPTQINCRPTNCNSCSFLIGTKNGTPTWWSSKPDSIPAKKKDSTMKKDANDFGDSLVISFDYTCEKGFKYTLGLVSDKTTGDGTVYMQRIEKKPAEYINEKVRDSKKNNPAKKVIRKPIAVASVAETEIKVEKPGPGVKQTITEPKKSNLAEKDSSKATNVAPTDTLKINNDSPVIVKSPFENFNAYHYNSSFDNIQLNYLNELRRLYPEMDISCARELIFLISNELFRHDTGLIKFRYGFDSSSAKAKPEKKKTASPGPVRQGSVSIIPQAPIIMEPEYSSASQVTTKMIDIKLHLIGEYDSTESVVVFSADTTLSNKLTILQPSRVITKENWDAAINSNNGIYDLKLRINTSSLKDSLQNLQTGFILIKGDTANPNSYQEVQLRSYNPNKPFWVEFGSNFDLLDGLQANNLYGGVFMYKKDVAKLSRNKNPNISMIGGVYESKTVSSEQAQNFANFQYLDNRTFVPPPVSPQYLVHEDTGTVTKTNSVRNLGIFISPQVRLTNGSAEADGLHVFLALWIELVWQRSTTIFDYSKTAQVDSFGVPGSQVQTYGYKPGTLEGDFRSHYDGVGLPIYLKEGNYNLYLNSIIGYSNQPGLYTSYKPTGFKDFSTLIKPTTRGTIPWLPFYLFQFRLSEERYGISFTGEIRGTIARNYKPFVTLALSKKFDLSRLLEFK